MPERPEVETIIRRLRNGTHSHPPLPGQTIKQAEILWDGIIESPDPAAFQQSVQDKTILDAQRRGKYLHFPLNEGHLIAHLRMSGDMHLERKITEDGPRTPKTHERVLLNLDSPWQMVFVSVRKFGRMWFVNQPQTIFGKLGPEPLSADFTAEHLYEKLQAHSRQLKPLLLDQSFIAGLGNIYSDEALHMARLHPLRKSDSISRAESHALHHSIQTVLKEGIRRFGASLDWVYRGGEFQNHFQVYQQTGERCPHCGTKIEKIRVGQRGTHFCPNCQQAPPKD